MDRFVLVTGASKGIGRATALRLDRLGFGVLAGVRREADGKALRAASGGRLVPILLDVTDATAIEHAAAIAEMHTGDAGLAGLVNNAGIAVAAPLEYLPGADLRRQLEVNLVGQHEVTRALLPLLHRAKGRIVNIGSVGGRIAGPFTGAYHASKFGLRALTDSLRLELRPWGVGVVLVEPGTIATDIWSSGITTADELRRRLPAEAETWYGRAMDARRARAERSRRTGIDPDEVAKVVEHALTTGRPRGRYLVGVDARVGAALALLPDGLRDRIIFRSVQRLGARPDRPATASVRPQHDGARGA